MQCPVCTTTQLVMSERQGIEIDYCPQCRGVWLDRGELDKIVERSAVAPIAAAYGRPQQQPQPGHHKGEYHSRKKKSFLGELFDFD